MFAVQRSKIGNHTQEFVQRYFILQRIFIRKAFLSFSLSGLKKIGLSTVCQINYITDPSANG